MHRDRSGSPLDLDALSGQLVQPPTVDLDGRHHRRHLQDLTGQRVGRGLRLLEGHCCHVVGGHHLAGGVEGGGLDAEHDLARRRTWAASLRKRSRRVARPTPSSSTPVASGSSVPECPILLLCRMPRALATTSCEVHPASLSTTARPSAELLDGRRAHLSPRPVRRRGHRRRRPVRRRVCRWPRRRPRRRGAGRCRGGWTRCGRRSRTATSGRKASSGVRLIRACAADGRLQAHPGLAERLEHLGVAGLARPASRSTRGRGAGRARPRPRSR